MASPLLRGQTAPVAGGSVTSPASTQVGDLVVVYTFERLGAAAGSTLSVNAGAGFAQIRNHFHDDGSTDGAIAVAYKVATQAGAQSYQGFTSSTGTPAWWTGCTVYQAGTFDASAIVANSVSQTNNAVPNPPSVTGLTSTRDYVVLAIAGWHLGSALTNAATAPANYGNLSQLAGSANADLAVATRDVTGVTSEDPAAFGDNQAPNGTCAITVAIPNVAASVGNLAATFAAMVLVGAGVVGISGAATPTLDAATLSGTGSVAVAGSTTVPLDAMGLSASGSVAESGVTGALEATFDGMSLSAAGAVRVSGSASVGLESATVAGSGSVAVLGQSEAMLAGATLEASGAVAVTGATTPAFDACAVSAGGSVSISGGGSQALDECSLVASADVIVSGGGAVALAGLSLEASGIVGQPPIEGSLAAVFDDCVLIASGSVEAAALPIPDETVVMLPMTSTVVMQPMVTSVVMEPLG